MALKRIPLTASNPAAESRIAVVSVLAPPLGKEAAWLATCYQVTARVQRLSSTRAALDLGACTEHEAGNLAQRLSDHLQWLEISARVGIGPSIPVAELAVLASSPRQRVVLVSAADTPAFMKRHTISTLCALTLPMPISEEVTLQLRRYGVCTLGHLARFDELTLRRQFGTIGGQLARLARGEAPLPFQLMPPPAALRFRTRFGSPVSVEQAVRRLPGLAAQVANQLQTQRQIVGTLTLTIWWESGGVERTQMTLREPTHERGMLTRHVRHLLTSLLRSVGRVTAEQIDRLEIQTTDLAPERARQEALWSSARQRREDRLRALQTVAETLTQRHGRPLLHIVSPTNEAAVFSEDRFAFRPIMPDAPDTLSAKSRSVPHRQAKRSQDPPTRLHWW